MNENTKVFILILRWWAYVLNSLIIFIDVSIVYNLSPNCNSPIIRDWYSYSSDVVLLEKSQERERPRSRARIPLKIKVSHRFYFWYLWVTSSKWDYWSKSTMAKIACSLWFGISEPAGPNSIPTAIKRPICWLANYDYCIKTEMLVCPPMWSWWVVLSFYLLQFTYLCSCVDNQLLYPQELEIPQMLGPLVLEKTELLTISQSSRYVFVTMKMCLYVVKLWEDSSKIWSCLVMQWYPRSKKWSCYAVVSSWH